MIDKIIQALSAMTVLTVFLIGIVAVFVRIKIKPKVDEQLLELINKKSRC